MYIIMNNETKTNMTAPVTYVEALSMEAHFMSLGFDTRIVAA